MKKIVAMLLALVMVICVTCMLVPSLAFAKNKAEEPIPERYASIGEAWNATTTEALHLNIIEYWKASATSHPKAYAAKHFPCSIRFGGTTKELIADKENWDLAIVSSKDVDLQVLADEQLIMCTGYNPSNAFALHQWLLPKELQSMLPNDPLMLYYVYVYDYDVQTDEAVFLVCQAAISRKKNGPRQPQRFAAEIMRVRPVETTRALEGIRQISAWTVEKLGTADQVRATEGMRPPDAWTEDDLIAHADEWDVAIIMMDIDDKLDKLNQAGLLYDFSQNDYFLSRTSIRPYERECGNNYCELRNGVFNEEGQMIGIPCIERIRADADTEGMLILNAQSAVTEKALAYSIHLMKSMDWTWTAENKMWPHGCDTCIYKDEVDW